MATRYWVGGSGTWNNVTTTNWSATSGGAGGASVPTANDDVIFNAASAGVSYVVTCAPSLATTGLCKSITTSAPATGTLTFNQVNVDGYFKVFDGNVNIHAACLFTGFGTITHAPTTAGTYTVTFNSPGANTQTVKYVFTQVSASTTLNFCNSNTATFQQMSLSVGGTFVCTSAVLTNTAANPSTCIFGGGATSVTMTGTTLNMTGTGSTTVTVGGSATTTWAVSTLAVNMTGFTGTNSLLVGQNAATQPTAMGAVAFTNCSSSAWFARATTLTLTSSRVTMLTGVTTSGNLTINTGSELINPSHTSSIGGTTTLAGTGRYLSTSNTASTTFVGAATAADGGFNGDVTPSINTVYALGSLTFQNGLTITPTGANTPVLFANVIAADAIATTNTFVYAATSLTVNGGLGKAFSYTVNASANAVNVNRGTVFGNPLEYPNICATTASITTPTTSFVGTNVRRVVYGQPRSSTKTVNDTLTISGSTPTLTNVTFLGTSITGGASNYSGTRLGTDSLSDGFLPATGVQKYVVLAANGAFDTAIWALTSGGATSADNYPLPQDTIFYGSSSNSFSVTYTGQLHIGTVNMTTFGSFVASSGGGVVYCYGDVSLTASGAYFAYAAFQMAQSGSTNRYLTNTQGLDARLLESGINAKLVSDTGNTTNLTVSGFFWRMGYAYFYSGTNEYLIGTQFGWDGNSLADLNFSGGTHTMRTPVFYTSSFTIGPGTTFPSSNYTVEMSTVSTGTLGYSNAAPSTALNGSLRLIQTNFTAAAVIGGTSAANPLKSLTLTNAFGSPYPSLNLPAEDVYLEAFTTGTNLGWNLQGGGGVRGFYKTNGGTVSVSNVFVNNVIASPANTFYATGSSTLTGTTTGWTLSAAPASPSSGGFFMF